MAKGSKGAGPKPKMPSSRASNKTNSPKGGFAGQVTSGQSSGMNTGGVTDRQVRNRVAGQGAMLSKQLAKNKSTGVKVPGMKTPSPTRSKSSGKVKKV